MPCAYVCGTGRSECWGHLCWRPTHDAPSCSPECQHAKLTLQRNDVQQGLPAMTNQGSARGFGEGAIMLETA